MKSNQHKKALFKLETYNRMKRENPNSTKKSIADVLGDSKKGFQWWLTRNTVISQPEQRAFKPGRRTQGGQTKPMKMKND